LGVRNHRAASGLVLFLAHEARICPIEDSKYAGKSTISARPKVVAALASVLIPASN
jgi:hypothetical protein